MPPNDEPENHGRPTTAVASNLLARIPGPRSDRWPQGERFAAAIRHGTMSVELYAPIGDDPQTAHAQDELYFVHSGTGLLIVDGESRPCAPGTCLFVPAGVEHRFADFSADFVAWVVFWGPPGGERAS